MTVRSGGGFGLALSPHRHKHFPQHGPECGIAGIVPAAYRVLVVREYARLDHLGRHINLSFGRASRFLGSGARTSSFWHRVCKVLSCPWKGNFARIGCASITTDANVMAL